MGRGRVQASWVVAGFWHGLGVSAAKYVELGWLDMRSGDSTIVSLAANPRCYSWLLSKVAQRNIKASHAKQVVSRKRNLWFLKLCIACVLLIRLCITGH